ncbi:MAG: nodulation protein NfeD [Myxococcota bacterium]|jgi:membrane-bound serine protease (ClpP class)|nr:nodulation protein NfeD [Myxococcota bacterium]
MRTPPPTTVLFALLCSLAAPVLCAADTDSAHPSQEDVLKTLKNALDKAMEKPADTEAPSERPEGVPASPEPESTSTELPTWRQLPAEDPQGGAGKKVVVVPIHDIIDMGLASFVARSIENNKDAAAVVLDINTPGGRIDAALLIRDALLNAPKTLRTVAFVHPRAISAGALISLACDLIFIADGGTIGAATPISLSAEGEAEAVGEKTVSYFRAEMASTARAKGRRGDIAEAMVDAEVELPGIIEAGKLLTLDTTGALKHRVADAKANTLDEVLTKLALGSAQQETQVLNWAEELARIFTNPILAGILMSIGVLGILIELYHPGFGLPGIVGVLCLLIFFAGHLVVNLAGWEEVLLFVLGVGLLVTEIFVTPGFGILGILGIGAILSSLVLALSATPIDVSFSTGAIATPLLRVLSSLAAAGLLFVLALVLLPKSARRNPLVLGAAITASVADGKETSAARELLASGQVGTAESPLRPAGIARFDQQRVDVVAEGEFLEKGTPVVVRRVEGYRVVVSRHEGNGPKGEA